MIEQNQGLCINEGCNKPRVVNRVNADGTVRYRPVCSHCYVAGRGLQPFAKGVTPVKKKYCENRDGRLGIVCRATNLQPFQLDLDHIDGNRENNKVENIQTLCKNCHALKSKQEGNHNKHRSKDMPLISNNEMLFKSLFDES